MSAEFGSADPSPDRSRRAFVRSVGAGLASLGLLSTTDAAAGPDKEADLGDGTGEAEATITTALSFDSATVTTGETTMMTCEWELTTHPAPGGFHTLKTVVQSGNIDAPETVTEPFEPNVGWGYDVTGESVPIRGPMYRWSVRDRWTTPGTYRVRARVDPFYPGEITALAGPYGGNHFDWAKDTLSVEW